MYRRASTRDPGTPPQNHSFEVGSRERQPDSSGLEDTENLEVTELEDTPVSPKHRVVVTSPGN